MKKILCIYIFFFFQSANAQSERSSNSERQNNINLAVNILSPLFGEYSLGIYTFITPFIQAGINGTYYSTQYVTPEVNGWQTELRANYFFSTHYRSSFYLGAAAGIESVDVKKESSTTWENYRDFTWAIIPGYAWVIGKSFTMMLGLSYGYNLGDTQIGPEIGAVFLL